MDFTKDCRIRTMSVVTSKTLSKVSLTRYVFSYNADYLFKKIYISGFLLARPNAQLYYRHF